MNEMLPPAAPLGRGRILRLIADHNPFYLLSAICMLGGCLTLTNSLSYSPIPRWRLLGLIATLNCYELLIVGLSVWLIVYRNELRDAMFLLCIEALFMADVAMLDAELFTIDQRLGAIVNGLLLLLTAAKLAFIFRALRIASPAAFSLVLVHLSLLLVLPGIFKHVSQHTNGRLGPMLIYGSWWVVGILPVLSCIVFREPSGFASQLDLRPRRYPRIVGMFVWCAFGSIVLHLRLTNWVYAVDWQWANIAPLLLGAAVAIGAKDHHIHTLAMRMRAQLVLPILAVAFSMRFPSGLTLSLLGIDLTPMRLAMAGCLLVYLHGLWLHRHLYFAVATATCVMGIGIGPTPALAHQHVAACGDWVLNMLRRLIPRTSGDWGVLSVIASFVLLVLGAAVSILKAKLPIEPPPDDVLPLPLET